MENEGLEGTGRKNGRRRFFWPIPADEELEIILRGRQVAQIDGLRLKQTRGQRVHCGKNLALFVRTRSGTRRGRRLEGLPAKAMLPVRSPSKNDLHERISQRELSGRTRARSFRSSPRLDDREIKKKKKLRKASRALKANVRKKLEGEGKQIERTPEAKKCSCSANQNGSLSALEGKDRAK